MCYLTIGTAGFIGFHLPNTIASPALLERLINYRPTTPISVGVSRFVDWYEERYQP